jgi:hypothetical protein
MPHQILPGGECVAGHSLPGSLDQQVVPVLGSSDSLGPRIVRRLRHACKNGLDEGIQQGVERLLPPDNSGIVTGHALESSYDPIFSLGQLRSSAQFVLDCRSDEGTWAPIASRFDRFRDPIPIFPAQPDRDPGCPRRTCVLLHKAAPSLTKRIFETDSSASNTRQTFV